MKLSLTPALALLGLAAACGVASAQAPGQCESFLTLRKEAEQKALAVRNATQHKAERKEVCVLVQRFATAEGAMVKFLVDNKTWCGVPDSAIKEAKENHEKTLKFRTMACTEAPAAQPKPPTLSDAIGTPSIDSASNTKTGRGTLDSLNGNPLAR